MRIQLKDIVRWLMTIILLVEVFQHAHWSVGVSLGLVFVAVEKAVRRVRR